MGIFFNLRDANIIAYLTVNDSQVPRLSKSQLENFLENMSMDERGTPLISTDPTWPQKIAKISQNSLERLKQYPHELDELNEENIENLLKDLRKELTGFWLYGLVVGVRGDQEELESQATQALEFAKFAAKEICEKGLFLIPLLDPYFLEDLSINPVLDPIPAYALALEELDKWPGIVFWTRKGTAAFAPISDVLALYVKIQEAFNNSEDAANEVLLDYKKESNSRRILHLSDLHFGTKYASRNKAYLLGRLEEIKHSIDRVVITGDLSDNPSERDADDFYDFRASCQRISRNEPIVVPGNHDQRWLGNIAGGKGRLAELELSPVVHDDDIRCVFFCFNSAIKGDFARGRITNRQFMRVATKFQNDGNLKPKIREYLRIALVHHHPFSYQVEPVTLVQRVMRKVKLADEPFMRLEDAEDFVKWAARMNVEFILHGHMHKQIYLKKYVQVPEGERSLCAVECGASLGAEGTSLTYNQISWDSSSKKWTVTFWADPGDGSGFSRQAIAIQEVKAEN